jgi:hypothetical protein
LAPAALAAQLATPSIAPGTWPGQAPAPVTGDAFNAQVMARDAAGMVRVEDMGAGFKLVAGFQKLEATATGDGLTVFSQAMPGAGLTLKAGAYGREGKMVPLAGTGKVERSGPVVRFLRPGLTEEYSVNTDGVRQDFIVAQRPDGTGPLTVQLDLRGATAAASGHGALLSMEQGGGQVAYDRLLVTDASGKALPAALNVVADNKLAVVVQDADAVYPVRIDPTYSNANWHAMGAGTNALVQAIAVSGSTIYAGGTFTTAGGGPASHIAKWDGSTWTALGSGLNGAVYALAVIGTDLYAGGFFSTAGGNPANNIAKWDGTNWTALGSGTNNLVGALLAVGTDLYAGGVFTTAGGNPANYIAKWDGTNWSALGAGTNNMVLALASIGTDVYAGGNFTMAGGGSAARIAKWDGSSWSALGAGVDNYVYALTVSRGDLIVGGSFTTAGGSSANRIARWDGSSWSTLGSGVNNWVYALSAWDTDIFAGGRFTAAGGNSATRVAKWDGSAWSAMGSGANNNVLAMRATSTDLYIGGAFSTVGGNAAASVARGNIACSKVVVNINTDANGDQISWEFTDALNTVIATGGPSTGENNMLVSDTVCIAYLPVDDFFGFRLLDSFGDGITNGGWELRTPDGKLILADVFDSGSQSPSATPLSPGYGSSHSLCLPLGPANILATECNIFTNEGGNKVYCNKVTGATQYQFEFSDPDAGRIRRIARSTNYVHFWDMVTSPLTPGVKYFARVRTNASGPMTTAHWGSGCEMGLASSTPCSQLIMAPAYGHSCNESRSFNTNNSFIYATPVPGATEYQFRIYNTGEGYDQTFVRSTYILQLKWNSNIAPPLLNGSTYNVEINVKSFGEYSGFCASSCTITINNPPARPEGLLEQLPGSANLWPNPVRDGQVHLDLTGLEGADQQIAVDIQDIYGKQVYAQDFANGGERFSTVLQLPNSVASGVYMVNITVNGKRTVQRLSIIR